MTLASVNRFFLPVDTFAFPTQTSEQALELPGGRVGSAVAPRDHPPPPAPWRPKPVGYNGRKSSKSPRQV